MKIAAITTMALMAGTVVQAESLARAAEQNVIVCVERGAAFLLTTGRAEMIASKLFATIGVKIDWRRGLPGCPAQGIQVSFGDHTPATLMPRALAYALPFEGTHILLFYDRISLAEEVVLPHLLAHVLVHEITHILQGTCRHSDHGVMRARWDDEEVSQMRWKPFIRSGRYRSDS